MCADVIWPAVLLLSAHLRMPRWPIGSGLRVRPNHKPDQEAYHAEGGNPEDSLASRGPKKAPSYPGAYEAQPTPDGYQCTEQNRREHCDRQPAQPIRLTESANSIDFAELT
jgi:hypothetical protein